MLKQIVEQGVISHTAPPSAPAPPPLLHAHRLARRLEVHYAGRGTAAAAVAPYTIAAQHDALRISTLTLEPLVPKRLTDTVPPRVRSRLAASGLHPRHPTRRHTHASYSSEVSYQLLPSHIKRKSLWSDDELRH